MTTRTLTALFADHATAELAAERLRAAGVPEKSIEIRRADEGDVAPGNAPSGGLFAVGDLLRTEFDTPGITRGVEAGGTVLVAFGVPEDLALRGPEDPQGGSDRGRGPARPRPRVGGAGLRPILGRCGQTPAAGCVKLAP